MNQKVNCFHDLIVGVNDVARLAPDLHHRFGDRPRALLIQTARNRVQPEKVGLVGIHCFIASGSGGMAGASARPG